MIQENLLTSVIRTQDVTILLQVKDFYLSPKMAPIFAFVRDYYVTHNLLPTLDAVEIKYNKTFTSTNDPAKYWLDEVKKIYKQGIAEQAIKDAARTPAKSIEIFQQAILDSNTDYEHRVTNYGGAGRASAYNQSTGKYLSTGSDAFNEAAMGYSNADLWTIGGREGIGKMAPYTEPVLTPTGWKQMGDIKVGSEVLTPKGFSTRVVKVHPHKNLEIYRIEFCDGTWTECCIDHLWKVITPRQKTTGGHYIKTVRELLEDYKKPQSQSYHYSVPLVEPLNFEGRNLPMHPQLLGWLLGDGYLPETDGMVCIAVHSPDVDEVLAMLTPTLSGFTAVKHKQQASVVRIALSAGIKPILKGLGLLGKKSADKFIPEDYLFADVSARKQLLSGLLDTDGHCKQFKGKKKVSFSSTSPNLANGVAALVRSLGGWAKIASYDRTHENKGLEYRVSIRLPFNPFILSRKANAFGSSDYVKSWTKAIINIEYVGLKDGQCITVEDAEHLYITRDFTVTHNSWLVLNMAMWLDVQMLANGIQKPILFATCEMGIDECVERLDCLRFGLPYDKFIRGTLSPADELRYARGIRGMESNIKFIDDCFEIDDVENYVTLYQPALTFIDGSHLLAKDYDWKEIGALTMKMKKLSRRKQCPIINTTHLKSGKGKSSTGGDVDDFAYGKGFTRDSDVVGVLYMDEQMEYADEIGIDFVKVRRGQRTRVVFKRDFVASSMSVVSVTQGLGSATIEEEDISLQMTP